MYICERCGKEYEDLPTYNENIDGINVEYSICECDCGGGLEESITCEHCENEFIDYGEEHNLCKSCVKKARTLSNAFAYIEEYELEAEFYVRFLLNWNLSKDDLSNVPTELMNYLKDRYKKSLDIDVMHESQKEKLLSFVDFDDEFYDWWKKREGIKCN